MFLVGWLGGSGMRPLSGRTTAEELEAERFEDR